MAEAESAEESEAPKKKRSALPLLLGVILSVGLGGGGFYASYSGLLDLGGSSEGESDHQEEEVSHETLPDIEFVPIDPLIVTLAGSGPVRHLRFRAELEVAHGEKSGVTSMMPRILDAMNGYLRAVTVSDLERSTALLTLRAQMLRRVQLVVGETRVRDLLVTEFVLN